MSALPSNAYSSMLFVLFCSIRVSVCVNECVCPFLSHWLLSTCYLLDFALGLLQYNIQVDHCSVPCPVNKIPRVLITPTMPPTWANDHDVAHLQAKTVPKKHDLEWINPVVAALRHLQDSKGLYHAHGHAHYDPMGKWLWCCTSTGEDSSKELDLEWIDAVGFIMSIMPPWSNGHGVARL